MAFRLNFTKICNLQYELMCVCLLHAGVPGYSSARSKEVDKTNNKNIGKTTQKG